MIHGTQTEFCDNLEGWDGVGGEREVQEEPMADSCGCMAETNTILQSSPPSIKGK